MQVKIWGKSGGLVGGSGNVADAVEDESVISRASFKESRARVQTRFGFAGFVPWPFSHNDVSPAIGLSSLPPTPP
jgi:hypothetical protein